MRIIQTEAEAHEILLKETSTEQFLVTPLKSKIVGLNGNTAPEAAADLFEAQMFALQYGTDLVATDIQYKVHYLSRKMCQLPGNIDPYAETSLMMRGLHSAFSHHIPFSLNPDSIWYCIAHELAIHINQNQDRYRGYFTVSDEKDTLEVRNDSLVYGGDPEQWVKTLQQFREPITKKVPRATIDLLIPQFTTTTEESRIASLVLFLNILSNYYEIYVHSLCGIPEIRIEGDATDWKKIVDHAQLASHEFDGLKAYFADLIPVLKEIAGVAAGDAPDPEFWCSIYKYKSRSGGGGINGWITTLLAHHKHDDGRFELRNKFNWRAFAESKDSFQASLDAGYLPGHISTVPFNWHYLDKTFNMLFVTGFMSIEYDGFLNPKLGYGVLEKQTLTN